MIHFPNSVAAVAQAADDADAAVCEERQRQLSVRERASQIAARAGEFTQPIMGGGESGGNANTDGATGGTSSGRLVRSGRFRGRHAWRSHVVRPAPVRAPKFKFEPS